MEQVMVSVWCLTYNHAPYIKDALNGFLEQETNFKYQVIIHDDASTDGTTEILREYEAKYPEIFKVFYEEKNTYKSPDFVQRINHLKETYLTGKYVAFCEGDDYWIDSKKLQKQVDYLENHSDCVMVVHDAEMINYKENDIRRMRPKCTTGVLTDYHIIMQQNGMIPTASFLFRRDVMLMSPFFYECGIGDFPLLLNALSKGKVYYIAEVMSRYRFLQEGSWSSRMQMVPRNYIPHCVRMIDFLVKYERFRNGEVKDACRDKIRNYMALLTNCYMKEDVNSLDDIKELLDYSKYKRIADTSYKCLVTVKDEASMVEKIVEYSKTVKNLYVWGNGIVSEAMSRLMTENGVEIKGYIVTSNWHKDETEFLGKPVWEFENFKDRNPENGIVIATKSLFWTEICFSLEENQLLNYCLPFEIDVSDLLE